MTRELTSNTGRTIALLVQVVDGADVVETTASHEVTTGCIGASHNPGGTQGNGVDLVGGIGIPNNELAILRSRNQVPPIGRPVHGVNLSQVTLQCSLGLHKLVLGNRLMSLLCDSAN